MKFFSALFLATLVVGCGQSPAERASMGAIAGIAVGGLVAGPFGAIAGAGIGIAGSYAVPQAPQAPERQGGPQP